MQTLPVFSKLEYERAKVYLATQVADMMGRKLEEGDWSRVYCAAKGIPDNGWSNLNIDINFNGLGVEHKLLRCSSLKGKSLKTVCGTTLMHPSATRSIRIADTTRDSTDVMYDVFLQYAELIQARTRKVMEKTPELMPDMRTGWLLWEDSLTEFLYFEESLSAPDPTLYFAEWNETPAKGARKASKSLWIYEKDTNKKRYSVTTSAGIKIQPYFDVPVPTDQNLYYFRVQAEPVDKETIQIWVSATTAQALERILGTLEKEVVSQSILETAERRVHHEIRETDTRELARPIQLTLAAFERFSNAWNGVSDEHRAQLFLESLQDKALVC